jgi:hypothetical protein
MLTPENDFATANNKRQTGVAPRPSLVPPSQVLMATEENLVHLLQYV